MVKFLTKETAMTSLNEFISSILAILKIPIGSKHPTLLIRLIRMTRNHRAIYKNRKTQAQHVDTTRHAFK